MKDFLLYDNFEIIHDDILKVDLKSIIKNEKKENQNMKEAKIVANLPYYITTPIIMKLLEEKLDLKTITVMVQKEVADRLTALPGTKKIRSYYIWSLLLCKSGRGFGSIATKFYTSS